MVKYLEEKNQAMNGTLQTKCNACDLNFNSEVELKDHILTTIHKGPSDGTRFFKYRLTAKTAKTNLLKGALRKHMDIQHKQGATNLDFSDGAWILAVLPEVLNWDNGNRHFSYGDLNMEVIEAKPGVDDDNKHMDYKIVFRVNGMKVVLHAYNSKQRFTVSGQNRVNFVNKFLDPFFSKKIEDSTSDANKFNQNVLAKLGKTVKRGNVKFRPSTSVACNQCDQISKSVSQLHTHMRFNHEMTMSLNISTQSDVRHSTKNNSIAESIMGEDVSLEALLHDSIEKMKPM